MGSSTALHLIRSGYTPSNITVLDAYPIPSAQSAGYDLNKIMSIRLHNKPGLQLSLEALNMWKNDALFKPFFHNVGMVSHETGFITRNISAPYLHIWRSTVRRRKKALKIFGGRTNPSLPRIVS